MLRSYLCSELLAQPPCTSFVGAVPAIHQVLLFWSSLWLCCAFVKCSRALVTRNIALRLRTSASICLTASDWASSTPMGPTGFITSTIFTVWYPSDHWPLPLVNQTWHRLLVAAFLASHAGRYHEGEHSMYMLLCCWWEDHDFYWRWTKSSCVHTIGWIHVGSEPSPVIYRCRRVIGEMEYFSLSSVIYLFHSGLLNKHVKEGEEESACWINTLSIALLGR